MEEIHRMLDQAIMEAIKDDPSMAEYHDWHYRDLPRMSQESLDALKNIIGESNLKWLTFADYGTSVRGQVLISPNGMEALAEFNRGVKQ